jgi:hypothetical protein
MSRHHRHHQVPFAKWAGLHETGETKKGEIRFAPWRHPKDIQANKLRIHPPFADTSTLNIISARRLRQGIQGRRRCRAGMGGTHASEPLLWSETCQTLGRSQRPTYRIIQTKSPSTSHHRRPNNKRYKKQQGLFRTARMTTDILCQGFTWQPPYTKPIQKHLNAAADYWASSPGCTALYQALGDELVRYL